MPSDAIDVLAERVHADTETGYVASILRPFPSYLRYRYFNTGKTMVGSLEHLRHLIQISVDCAQMLQYDTRHFLGHHKLFQ